jgi:fructose-bisphosphate aldolase class II
MKSMLDEAATKGYAVGSFNVVSLDSLQGILEAATQLQSPVILSVAEVHFKYVDLEYVVPVIKQAAAKAPVPVASASRPRSQLGGGHALLPAGLHVADV